MELHPFLLRIKQKFYNNYFIEEVHPNIIRISNTKDEMPFAIVMYEPKNPNSVIVSFSVEAIDASQVADLIIGIMYICHVELAETYYISKTGHTYFGQDAFNYFTLDNQIDLNKVEPLSSLKH